MTNNRYYDLSPPAAAPLHPPLHLLSQAQGQETSHKYSFGIFASLLLGIIIADFGLALFGYLNWQFDTIFGAKMTAELDLMCV